MPDCTSLSAAPCKSSRPTCWPICRPLSAVIWSLVKVFSPSDLISRRVAVELFCAAAGGGASCASAFEAIELQIDAERNNASANVPVLPGMFVFYRKCVGTLQAGGVTNRSVEERLLTLTLAAVRKERF